MKLKPVRLLRPYKINNSGEVCGFPEDEAKRLIEQKYAVPFEARAVIQKEAEKPEPDPVIDPAAVEEKEKPKKKKAAKRGRPKKKG